MAAPLLLSALGAVLGAIFGAFIAVLVLRWPAGRSVRGRSACDGCGAPVAARDLVPILSFTVRRGRARCCGGPIDRVHPLAELVGAAIGAASFGMASFGIAPLPEALAGALFGWLLLALALLDTRHFWLPNRLTATLGLAGLAVALAGIGPPPGARLIGALVGYLALEGVRRGYRALRRREGLGGGDAKLFAGIGAWLGWAALPAVLLGASVLGLLCALALVIGGRRLQRTSRLPLGTFLAIAAWSLWLAGQIVRPG